MIVHLFMLGCFVLPLLIVFLIGGIIEELVMNHQERKEINIKVGDCLRGKK